MHVYPAQVASTVWHASDSSVAVRCDRVTGYAEISLGSGSSALRSVSNARRQFGIDALPRVVVTLTLKKASAGKWGNNSAGAATGYSSSQRTGWRRRNLARPSFVAFYRRQGRWNRRSVSRACCAGFPEDAEAPAVRARCNRSAHLRCSSLFKPDPAVVGDGQSG